MKGDFTRNTHRPKKHYRSVRMQQGRVQLDADWNEQLDISGRRTEIETVDVAGSCAAPMKEGGFKLEGGAGVLTISRGRIYVDGLLAENENPVGISAQPDLPGLALPANNGFYLAYLDVWLRHITALEDPEIREVALGGPDTATRQKVVWQVRYSPVANNTNCLADLKPWLTDRPPSTCRLKARSQVSSLGSELCEVPASGGYRRMENQLYRVEIHTAGVTGAATFKWSRDNGSMVTTWISQDQNELTVKSIGPDPVLGFARGQTVELSDDGRELLGQPGLLVRLSNAEGQVLTLDQTDPAAATVNKANFPDLDVLGQPNHPKVRRWDSPGALDTAASWIELEDGVQVFFEANRFHNTGDYWLIPARTATDDVEWPEDLLDADGKALLPPEGIEHHYCKLGIIQKAGNTFTVEDCRPLFEPLTELLDYSYIGGDGQEAMPGIDLPQMLKVGVMRGLKSLVGAQVVFTTPENGLLNGAATTKTVNTLQDGVASVTWKPNPATNLPAQKVFATLIDPIGSLADPFGNKSRFPPVVFGANLSLAKQVYYDPANCAKVGGATTVQEALDALCKVQGGGGSCCCISVGGKSDVFQKLEDAIKQLLAEKKQAICLCLQPGEYELKLAQFEKDLVGIDLTIKGCGFVRLELKETLQLKSLAGIHLMHLEVDIPELKDEQSFIFLNDCQEISIENCRIMAQDLSENRQAMLIIAKASRIILRDNHLESFRGSGKDEFKAALGALDMGFLLEKTSNLFEFRAGAQKFILEKIAPLPQTVRRPIAEAISTQVKNMPGLTGLETDSYRRFVRLLVDKKVDGSQLLAVLEQIREEGEAAMPGLALLLADGEADTYLQDNTIIGLVSLYGDPFLEFVDIKAHLKNFTNKLHETGLGTGGQADLHVQGNNLTGIVLARHTWEIISKSEPILVAFANGFIADNVFRRDSNEFLAVSLGITSNKFHLTNADYYAAAIAEVATFIGNRGSNQEGQIFAYRDLYAEAANKWIVFADF